MLWHDGESKAHGAKQYGGQSSTEQLGRGLVSNTQISS